MHELSIVLSIVELAEMALQNSGAHHIEQIDLEIGMLAGVQLDALEFAWPVGVRHSALERSHKVIHLIKPQLQCLHCQQEFSADEVYSFCPACHQYGNMILRGKELRIKSIIVN